MKNINYQFAGLLSLRSRNMENLQWKTMLYSGFVVRLDFIAIGDSDG